MSELYDIVRVLKEQRESRDSKEPLEKPADIDDEKCDPRLRERAAQWYGAELLKRKNLTPGETKYLGSEIAKHLREARENEANQRRV